MITIKRNEQQYIEVIKKHKLICDKCGSEDIFVERDSNGLIPRPIIIGCNKCKDSYRNWIVRYSVEDYNSLIRSLTEVELVEIEKFSKK